MDKFTVKENCRLVDALKKALGLSYPYAMRLLSEKKVKVNGKRVSYNAEIKAFDVVEVYKKDSKPLEVLYENDDIVAFFKPFKTDMDILTAKVKGEKGETCVPCHRLDTNTQGVTLYAKSEEVNGEIKKLFKSKSLTKKYLAAVFGEFKAEGVFEGYLFHDKEKNLSFVTGERRPDAEKIETAFSVVERFPDFTLVDIRLITGKTHQIRAHLKSLGYSLIGDGKYGNGAINRKFGLKNQELICYEIDFPLIGKGLSSCSGLKIVVENPKKYLKSVNIFK